MVAVKTLKGAAVRLFKQPRPVPQNHFYATGGYTNYVGPSMNPLLLGGDGLHIVPYKGRVVRRGDVIVFIPPGGETTIVHRVVSVDSRGIKTRGDNATKIDPWVLAPENILGCVVYIQRKNRRLRILGGSMGRITALFFRSLRLFNAAVSFLLHPVYQRMCRSTCIKKGLHGLLKPRVLSFSRPEGMELQLVIGHRLIGRCLPGTSQWEIRRPFRMFLDEELLPKNLPSRVTTEGIE